MTHPEDLSPGDYVAIVACKRDQWVPGPRRPYWCEAEDATFDGLPLQVKAVSYPFIAVELAGKCCSIDVRDWDVQKVSKRYALAMLTACSRGASTPGKPEAGHCPRCGSKLVQAYVSGSRSWRTVCKQCGYDGETVQPAGVIS